MFRDLIPKLSDRYRVIAPDLPGFGQSDLPPREQFKYTFANLAKVMTRFTEVLKLEPDQLEPPPRAVADDAHGFVKAVARVGSRLVMLIDFDKVIGEDVHHG